GDLPDLVYPVKTAGEELRYSLRSVAANARGLFRKVWLVGDRPEWVTGVGFIDAGNPVSRGEDVRAKVAAAAAHPELADTFVLMHDDYFLVDPIDHWQAYHMGPLTDHVAMLRRRSDTHAGWLRYVTDTAARMVEQGYTEGLTWQGHRPLLWDKVRLADALSRYPLGRHLDIVGLYEMAGSGGAALRGGNSKVMSDAKSFHAKIAARDTPWLSSNDKGFAEGMIGGYIRGMFREPSRFEK